MTASRAEEGPANVFRASASLCAWTQSTVGAAAARMRQERHQRMVMSRATLPTQRRPQPPCSGPGPSSTNSRGSRRRLAAHDLAPFRHSTDSSALQYRIIGRQTLEEGSNWFSEVSNGTVRDDLKPRRDGGRLSDKGASQFVVMPTRTRCDHFRAADCSRPAGGSRSSNISNSAPMTAKPRTMKPSI